MSTAARVVEAIDTAALEQIREARAAVRERAWSLGAAPCLTGWMVFGGS